MRGSDFAILLVFVGIPWVLGWIVRTVLSHVRYMRLLHLKAEANARLLDKFGANADLAEYMKTDAYRELFDVKLTEPSARMPVPYGRMLTSVQLAAFLLAAGIACLFVKQYVPVYPGRGPGDQIGWLFFGTMGVALGIGALVSAGAAFVAARLWQAMRNETV